MSFFFDNMSRTDVAVGQMSLSDTSRVTQWILINIIVQLLHLVNEIILQEYSITNIIVLNLQLFSDYEIFDR